MRERDFLCSFASINQTCIISYHTCMCVFRPSLAQELIMLELLTCRVLGVGILVFLISVYWCSARYIVRASSAQISSLFLQFVVFLYQVLFLAYFISETMFSTARCVLEAFHVWYDTVVALTNPAGGKQLISNNI